MMFSDRADVYVGGNMITQANPTVTEAARYYNSEAPVTITAGQVVIAANIFRNTIVAQRHVLLHHLGRHANLAHSHHHAGVQPRPQRRPQQPQAPAPPPRPPLPPPLPPRPPRGSTNNDHNAKTDDDVNTSSTTQ
jgi:hypothetical protein